MQDAVRERAKAEDAAREHAKDAVKERAKDATRERAKEASARWHACSSCSTASSLAAEKRGRSGM